MLFIILCSVLAVIFYFKQIKVYKYWKEKGVPYSKPLYFVGNFGGFVLRTKSFQEIVESTYNEFPNSSYVGLYQFGQPILMIRDPELIKQIIIKDFDAFPEHTPAIPSNVDPLWSKNLFFMSVKDGWHDMRATLSPMFTSSKMKNMFILMEECSTQFVNYFKKQNGKVSVETKDAFSRFTIDVIATTAFGITCDSLNNKDNEFYLMGKDISTFSGLRILKFVGYSFSSTIMKIFQVKIISKKVSTFFRNVIKQSIKIRTEQNIVRPDMLHLLMQARINSESENIQKTNTGKESKTGKQKFTDDDITAQAVVFFLAGFEGISSAMSFLAYELAINPDIQKKLYKEIKEAQENCSERITYEVLNSMKYLDCVVSECIRLHSTPLTDRLSIKPYTIQPKNSFEKPLHLEENSTIWIPTSALHHDEKYYPNPKKFDPDRFNEENKHKINPFTYLPFGCGQRLCIGARFALLEIKLITVQLLREFEIVPTEKTEIPLNPDKTSMTNLPSGGIWLGFNPRSTN